MTAGKPQAGDKAGKQVSTRGQRSVREDEKVLETGVEMAAQSHKDTSD